MAVAAAAAALCPTAPADAQPAAGDPSYSATTSVGVHNACEKAKYPYFADALDSGASLLELDGSSTVTPPPTSTTASTPPGTTAATTF
ncbi:hypothetical protein [Streptomyces sp. NPDC005336]|uniref:hypothetical protein n=1 Tax=Streptomyces sp. NPDC005336 TaxID=3157035 RepID=UPI0033BD9B3C